MKTVTYDPPRPQGDENTIRKGVRIFLERNPLYGAYRKEAEDAIVDVFSWDDDAYGLAKELERRHFWDVDMQLVEWLGNVWLYVDRELERQEKEWAEKNNIQPPFPVGTRVECRHGGKAIGVIEGVHEYGTARYLIEIDGVTDNSRAIVKFEDCWLPENEPVQ